MRTAALQALTALATNDQVKLSTTDGVGMLLAAGAVTASIDIGAIRSRHTPHALPSAYAFNASYYLLVAMLRQRPRLVHASVPLIDLIA